MYDTEEWRSVERKVDRLAHVVERRAFGLEGRLDRDDYRSELMLRALEIWQRRRDLPEPQRKWYVNRAVENLAWDIHRHTCYVAKGVATWRHEFPRVEETRDVEQRYRAKELLEILASELTPHEWDMLMAAVQWESYAAEDFDLEQWVYQRKRWALRARVKAFLRNA